MIRTKLRRSPGILLQRLLQDILPSPEFTLISANNKIIIPIDNKITLIDTPGIIDNSNMINFVDKKMYKRLNSKKEIKPRTYQLGKNQCLVLGDLVRIDYVEGDRNSLTFFIPNEIKIKRVSSRSDSKSIPLISIPFCENSI